MPVLADFLGATAHMQQRRACIQLYITTLQAKHLALAQAQRAGQQDAKGEIGRHGVGERLNLLAGGYHIHMLRRRARHLELHRVHLDERRTLIVQRLCGGGSLSASP